MASLGSKVMIEFATKPKKGVVSVGVGLREGVDVAAGLGSKEGVVWGLGVRARVGVGLSCWSEPVHPANTRSPMPNIRVMVAGLIM